MNYYSLSSVWYYHVYMAKKGELTIGERAIADAKMTGVTNSSISRKLMPDEKLRTGRTRVQRVLERPQVQEYIQKRFAAHDLTIDRAMDIIDKALSAEKAVTIKEGYDINIVYVPDWPSRLKATGEMLRLMQAYNKPEFEPDEELTPLIPDTTVVAPPVPATPQLNPELVAALTAMIKNGDIKALERVVFRDPKEVE